MRIETASGHTILADDADYPLLRDYSWSVTGSGGFLYAQARVPGSHERVKMHRLLMQPPPALIVHHKNNNGLDNRRCNLQVTTQQVNLRHARRSGTAYWDKQARKWRAQVRDETGKQVSLGMYETEYLAVSVVQNWNYRKMLELESIGTSEALHLAEVIEKNLMQGADR